jgi:hypothetical protein
LTAAPLVATPLGPALEREQVETALHAGAMRPSLLDAFRLPESTPCHVMDAKYEAGSYCITLYQLGDDLATGVLAFDDVDHMTGGGIRVGPGMKAFLFPDDPKLPGLRTLMDEHQMARLLGESRRARTRVTLLRYRPGKRATVRIEIRTATASRELIGKVYSKRTKAAAVHEEAHALARALGQDDGFRTARPLGYLEEPAIVIFEPVPGTEFEPYLDTEQGVAQVCRAAGAIAKLHALPPVSTRRRPVTAELERFHVRATNVARIAPDIGKRLVEWAAALVEHGARLQHGPPGLVHGDCKPSQFRIAAPRLALLDFDHCGLADPASDVGTFLASLRQRARRPLEQPFLDAYETSASPDATLRVRAGWYESVALMRKALRAFARSPRSPVPASLAHEGFECLETPSGGARWV